MATLDDVLNAVNALKDVGERIILALGQGSGGGGGGGEAGAGGAAKPKAADGGGSVGGDDSLALLGSAMAGVSAGAKGLDAGASFIYDTFKHTLGAAKGELQNEPLFLNKDVRKERMEAARDEGLKEDKLNAENMFDGGLNAARARREFNEMQAHGKDAVDAAVGDVQGMYENVERLGGHVPDEVLDQSLKFRLEQEERSVNFRRRLEQRAPHKRDADKIWYSLDDHEQRLNPGDSSAYRSNGK